LVHSSTVNDCGLFRWLLVVAISQIRFGQHSSVRPKYLWYDYTDWPWKCYPVEEIYSLLNCWYSIAHLHRYAKLPDRLGEWASGQLPSVIEWVGGTSRNQIVAYYITPPVVMTHPQTIFHLPTPAMDFPPTLTICFFSDFHGKENILAWWNLLVRMVYLHFSLSAMRTETNILEGFNFIHNMFRSQ